MAEDQKMSKVCDYMHRDIMTIPVEATLRETSQVMNEKGVGALLVKEGEDYVGFISEERLTREGVAKGLDAEAVSVGSIMRKNLITIESDQSVNEARKTMKNEGVRHLIVKEGNNVVGIITLSDLIRYYAEFFEDEE